MKIKEITKFKYELLDECFCRRNTEYSAEELHSYLLTRLEIAYGQGTTYSKRQLNRDIKKMGDTTDAPIASERRGNVWYYWYTDPNWSYRTPVFQNQLSRLGEAIVILDELQGLPHGRELAALKMRLQHHKNRITDVHNQILVFKSLPAGVGEEHVQPLYEAIISNTVLDIVYEKYNSNEKRDRTVHPYSLVEYEKHWYLFCYNEMRKAHAVFSLDRIKGIEKSKIAYRYNDVPADVYFKDVIGVTRLAHEEVQDIELLVSPKMAPYFLARALHHSQEELGRGADGSLHISLRLRINEELVDKLMGYGSEVRVLGSERLINRMRDEVRKLGEMYEGCEVMKGRVMELTAVGLIKAPALGEASRRG